MYSLLDDEPYKAKFNLLYAAAHFEIELKIDKIENFISNLVNSFALSLGPNAGEMNTWMKVRSELKLNLREFLTFLSNGIHIWI